MGKILHQIEYRVVDGSLPNDSKKLLAAAIEMSREPS
ncbi:tRNA nucleotidyltransferase, CCA-adding enzyme [Lacticaseibacillus rhamnosus MTCC 5462]|nr:tRNA nucleotidyltransferase, CCA-adding enzyme [Lacticaseibacillus rhamnosus MTCC 5462]